MDTPPRRLSDGKSQRSSEKTSASLKLPKRPPHFAPVQCSLLTVCRQTHVCLCHFRFHNSHLNFKTSCLAFIHAGYETALLHRHQLQNKIRADPSLITLYRQLPSTPEELRDPDQIEQQHYAAMIAGAAAASTPPLELACSLATMRSRSPSPMRRPVPLGQKKSQQLLDARLEESRPLGACVRLLVLLLRSEAWCFSGTAPIMAIAAQAFVSPDAVRRLLAESTVLLPSFDAEVVELLQEIHSHLEAKEMRARERELKMLNQATDPDDDGDYLDEEEEVRLRTFSRRVRRFHWAFPTRELLQGHAHRPEQW